jgi:hypothetical protein
MPDCSLASLGNRPVFPVFALYVTAGGQVPTESGRGQGRAAQAKKTFEEVTSQGSVPTTILSTL